MGMRMLSHVAQGSNYFSILPVAVYAKSVHACSYAATHVYLSHADPDSLKTNMKYAG